MKEARRDVASSPQMSEARIRQAAGGNGASRANGSPRGEGSPRVGGVADDRALRRREDTAVRTDVSEARVRQDNNSRVLPTASEARLRTRALKMEGSPSSRHSSRSPYGGGSPTSLTDQITTSGDRSLPVDTKRRPAAAAVLPVDSISSSLANNRAPANRRAELNPFESESANPFGDDFETEEDVSNPFAEDMANRESAAPEKDDLNPFAQEDDYDESLNPFGE